MRKTLVIAISYLLFASYTVWGQDAMHFLNLGINSSMAYNKIHFFTKALELNPGLSVAYEKRGMLYYFQGKYTETIQDFQRVIELQPLESEGYVILGTAYMKNENYDEAITALTYAVELDPNLAGAYGYRAEAYRLKGMVEEAIKDSTKAIEFGTSQRIIGKAYTTRSKAYRELGQNELADEDLKKSLKLDTEYDIYRFFSITEYLANWAGEFSSPKRVGWMGAALIIAILFVVIFKLALPPPKKGDDH